MAFIHDDEFIIYMDSPNKALADLPLEDLKILSGAGIRTAYLYGLDWGVFDKTPDYLSRKIDKFRAAGMKMLLPLWTWQTGDRNPLWYARDRQGQIPSVFTRKEYLLSPWNEAAQAYYNKILLKIKRAYEAPDVQIISIYNRAGESVMPKDARYYDASAIENWKAHGYLGKPDPNSPHLSEWIKERYVSMLLEQQRILVDTPWREIWYCLHYGKHDHPAPTGCGFIDDYLAAWQELKPASVNHITFSCFPLKGLPERVQQEHYRWGVNEWVGAEYVEGLRDGNAQRAIDLGFRGVVLNPCHGFTNHLRVEPWMTKYIGEAMKAWEGCNA